MVLIIVSTGMIVSYVSFRGSRRTVEFLVSEIMNDTRDRILADTLDYLYEGSDSLDFLASLVAGNQLLDGNRTLAEVPPVPGELPQISEVQRGALAGFLNEFLSDNAQFFSAAVTSPDGTHLRAIRMGDGTQSTLIQTLAGSEVLSRFEHQNTEYDAVLSGTRRTPLETAYRPRETEWYREAASENRLIWSDAEAFGYLPFAGLSAAVPVNRGGRLMGVLSLDIRLSEISRFLGASPGLDALTFIAEPASSTIIAFAEGSELIDSDRNSASGDRMTFQTDRFIIDDDGTPRVLTAKDIPESLVAVALAEFAGQTPGAGSGSAERLSDGDSVSAPIRYGERVYLSSFSPFPSDSGWDWGIGMLVPQSVFLDQIIDNAAVTLAISGLAMLVGAILSIAIARKISEPLRQLSVEMGQIRDFRLEDPFDVRSRLAEVDLMADSLASMKAGLRSFRKYVPAGLVRELIHLGQEAQLGGEEKRLTLFFSDIAGFTSISEKLGPQELVFRLATYLGALSDIIQRHRGTVDKYIGDAIMAFWGAPSELNDPELLAVEAALACQAEAKRISAEWTQEGLEVAFHIRIGINTGDLIVGNMGSENRLNYTVIGDAVNLASRLEGANKAYGTEIMISESTYRSVSHSIACRIIDRVKVKGKTEPITVYEPLGRYEELSDQQRAAIAHHNEAWELYRAREFRQAALRFQDVHRSSNGDTLAALYSQRCKDYAASPPEAAWDGVHTLQEK